MTEYAALGFDPAPGDPASVLALAKKLSASATSLGEASRVLKDLVSHSSAWQGEAATAFRASLSQDLPRYLGAAHTSLAEAARRLTGWHDTLVAHRTLAQQYEARAAAAKTEEAVTDARRLARELASEHGTAARRVAQTLNAATDRLAPKEPGLLASIWNKIVEDPADAMSNASAMLGFVGALVALACPPAGLAIMLVGSGLSLAALAMHTSDPKFRKSLSDGFTKGQFDADFWKSSVTLLGDTVGTVPGVAAVASGAKAGTAAARAAMAAAPEGSALTGLAPGATAFRQTAWSTSEDLRQLDSPLTGWAMRSSTQEARDRVGVAVAGTGALTAGMDYGSDSETLEHSSVAVDGTRGLLDDAPSAIRKSGHVWSVLRP
ncbi:putative T7SS-secreted protein [Streptomyces virginiae]|uniref:putative T7SS-secreted protein n=1 Tax=Streptomyces virginiae TaxID=1961 RepID=UPI0035D7EC84